MVPSHAWEECLGAMGRGIRLERLLLMRCFRRFDFLQSRCRLCVRVLCVLCVCVVPGVCVCFCRSDFVQSRCRLVCVCVYVCMYVCVYV